MSRHESFINRAVGVALTSQYRFRHGAVLTKGSKIVAYSPNVKRNDPNVDAENATYHAEEAAVRVYARVTGAGYWFPPGALKGYKIYIARVDADNEPVMSRPCKECWLYLEHLGIHDIGYTNEIGGLSLESVI